jgi:hypothetical protein
MKDQPCPIGFDILTRVYNAEARGTQRFAYYVILHPILLSPMEIVFNPMTGTLLRPSAAS